MAFIVLKLRYSQMLSDYSVLTSARHLAPSLPIRLPLSPRHSRHRLNRKACNIYSWADKHWSWYQEKNARFVPLNFIILSGLLPPSTPVYHNCNHHGWEVDTGSPIVKPSANDAHWPRNWPLWKNWNQSESCNVSSSDYTMIFSQPQPHFCNDEHYRFTNAGTYVK
jgi:hypothetical protein